MQKFCAKKQQIGDDISSYFYELEAMARAMSPNGYDEALLLQKFMSSLVEPYKALMHVQNPATIAEALAEARRLESNYAADAMDTEPVPSGTWMYNPTDSAMVEDDEYDEPEYYDGECYNEAFMQGVQANIDAHEPDRNMETISVVQGLTNTVAELQKKSTEFT